MTDITTIPMEELLADRQASLDDIEICEIARKMGQQYSRGIPLIDRIRDNEKIIRRIDIELRRRKITGRMNE